MTAFYDSIKSMRVAKIGTIMPWGGDGGNGFLASNIPKDSEKKGTLLFAILYFNIKK